MVNAMARLPDTLRARISAKRSRLANIKHDSDALRRLEAQMQVEFVYNSNGIEGSTLSLGETAMALRGMTVKGKSISEVLAAQNHVSTMQLVKDLAFISSRPIAEKDVLALHRAVMSGIISSAGGYRTGEVNIIGASFTPPPAYELQGQTQELLAFVNENPDELLPIELAAHAHYFIAWIHPFDDGNGRIARLLMNLILIRNKYPLAVIKKVERKKYLNALDTVTAKGDFQPFLVFIARCVEQSLDVRLNTLEGSPKDKLLSLSELAKSTPYSAEYLSLQARRGVLDAVKKGRIWYSTKKTIAAYMQEHGRK